MELNQKTERLRAFRIEVSKGLTVIFHGQLWYESTGNTKEELAEAKSYLGNFVGRIGVEDNDSYQVYIESRDYPGLNKSLRIPVQSLPALKDSLETQWRNILICKHSAEHVDQTLAEIDTQMEALEGLRILYQAYRTRLVR